MAARRSNAQFCSPTASTRTDEEDGLVVSDLDVAERDGVLDALLDLLVRLELRRVSDVGRSGECTFLQVSSSLKASAEPGSSGA